LTGEKVDNLGVRMYVSKKLKCDVTTWTIFRLRFFSTGGQSYTKYCKSFGKKREKLATNSNFF
jgi:hypothetical protein